MNDFDLNDIGKTKKNLVADALFLHELLFIRKPIDDKMNKLLQLSYI
jgi:hypothetical protein